MTWNRPTEEPEVLWRGPAPCEAVRINHSNASLHYGSETWARIEDAWRERQEDASDLRLFDGSLVHVRDIVAAEPGLVLDTLETSYKEYLASRSGALEGSPERTLAQPLAVGGAVRCEGGGVLAEVRAADLELYPGRVALVGGWVDPDEDLDQGEPAAVHALQREVREETGVEPEEIETVTWRAAVRTGSSIYLAADLEVPHAFEEIASRTPTEPEAREWLLLPENRSGVRSILIKRDLDLTPDAMAHLDVTLDSG